MCIRDRGEVGPDTEQLHAVVEDGHDQTTDDRPDDRAHTTGDGGATDEDGGDRVKLPADPVERTGGVGASDEHHPGQGGEDGHVHHDEEVDALAANAGELSRVAVAADCVDVPTDDRAGRDEAVDEHQRAEDEARHGERRALTA